MLPRRVLLANHCPPINKLAPSLLRPPCSLAASLPFFGVQPAIVDGNGQVLEGACEGNLVLLDSWPGTLIVVSHDRYLLERVTDQQYALMGDGRLRHLPGGVDEYLRLRKHSLTAGKAQAAKPAAGTAQPASASSSTTASPVQPKLSGAALRDAEKNLARIERALEKLAGDEATLHQQMAAHDQSDYEGLAKFATKQNELNGKREELELEWLELSDQLG